MARGQGFAIVTTTVSSRTDATRLAGQVVESRLAACVQYFPIASVYRWKGRVESAREHLLLAKTRRGLARRLTAFIKAHHTYEVPEIVVTPVLGGLGAYLRWLEACTSVRSRAGRPSTPA